MLFDRFVLKWCERGRGLKPDWATKGIEFIYFAANPTITKFLTDEEFEVVNKKDIEHLYRKENHFRTLKLLLRIVTAMWLDTEKHRIEDTHYLQVLMTVIISASFIHI